VAACTRGWKLSEHSPAVGGTYRHLQAHQLLLQLSVVESDPRRGLSFGACG
jgi:hypothetical protein